MAKNEAKIRFTAETGEFNNSIKKSNDEMSKLRAELKLNETEMQSTGKSAEGLENNHRILSKQLEQSENKTEALRNKLEKAKAIFGENSVEVNKLEIQLLNAQTAEVKLRDAVSDAEDELERFNKGLGDASDKAQEASDGFTVMKGAMASLVADGITAAASGLSSIATESFNMASDIDSATNTFIIRTGESVESAEAFEDVMTDIYNSNYGESFEDIAAAMATVKSTLGDISDDELKKVTADALILRDTFDFDVNESVRAANALMSQFGLTSEEAYNLIAQGAQNGLNRNGDLMDIINEYSVHFSQIGFSAEDMFNTLLAGAEGGAFSIDKVGDAMKEFGIRAIDGSEATKEAFKSLGLDADAMGKAFAEGGDAGVEAFFDVMAALQSLDDPMKQNQIGVALYGTMWEDLGTEVFAELETFRDEFNSTRDTMGELNTVKFDNLGSAFEGIKRNLQTSLAEPIKNDVMPAVNEFIEDVDWQGVGQTIGDAFGAIVEGALAIVDGVKGAVEWMKEHEAATIAIASVVGVLTTAITAYNIVQGIKTAMDAAQVTTVWGLVAAHWAQATAAMAALAPYILIVAAIAAVIAIIVLCVKYWDEIVAAVTNAWQKVKEVLAVVGEWINTNVIQPVVNFFKGLWDGVVNIFKSIIDWVKNNWKSIVLFFINPFAGVFNYLYENFEGFRNFIDGIVESVKGFFVGLWNKIKEIWDGICNVVQVAVMFIGAILSAAFQIITLPFRFIWENCKEYVFAAWEWIKGIVSTAIQAVSNVITTVMTAISSFFTTVWNGIKNVFTTVWTAIVTFLTPIIDGIKNAISTAWNAVLSVSTTVFNAIKSVIDTVWNAIKTAVETVANAIWSAVSTAWNAISTATSTAFNAVKTVASNVWNSIKEAISNVVNGVKSTISNVWNSIKTTTSNVFNGIKSTATSVWNGIKNAILTPIEAAKDKIKGIVDTIKGFFDNMKISLPHIKMPHFSISGKFSLDPPSVPKFSIQWYKEGGILTRPTIFGMNGSSFMAGGEAGPEAILPIDKLEGYIAGAIEKTMQVADIQTLANAIENLANRPVLLNVNGRNFATATANDADNVNGLRTSFKSRGLVLG